MDLTLLNPIHRLLLADAPGWRSDLGDQLNVPPVQQILAERKDDANTNSQYAAVIAPYTDTSPVQSAHLILNDPDTSTMAVAVKRDGCTDYILSAPEGTTHDLGPISITGNLPLHPSTIKVFYSGLICSAAPNSAAAVTPSHSRRRRPRSTSLQLTIAPIIYRKPYLIPTPYPEPISCVQTPATKSNPPRKKPSPYGITPPPHATASFSSTPLP